MRFAACPVFRALPGELKRTGEPRRRQSGCIGTPALSGNWKPFDIAGTAKTMTATLRLYRFAASVCLGRRRPRAGRERGVFLERVFARLQLHRGFTDADLDNAVGAALTGLIQSAA